MEDMELTKPHYLTQAEADLILEFRQLAPHEKGVVETLVKYTAITRKKLGPPRTDNVVSIGRRRIDCTE